MDVEVIYQCKRCGNVFDNADSSRCPSCSQLDWANIVDKNEIFQARNGRKYNPLGQLNKLCNEISEWAHEKGFNDGVWGNMFFQLMRIVNECSECSEAYRRLSPEAIAHLTQHGLDGAEKLPDNDIRDIRNIEEEVADIAIVLFALSHDLGLDLENLVRHKMQVNETRPHKHGKRC